MKPSAEAAAGQSLNPGVAATPSMAGSRPGIQTLSPQDSSFDVQAFERALERQMPTRWIGWRLRLLVGVALLGCLGLFGLVRHLAATPHLDGRWQTGPQGLPVLLDSADPALAPRAGRSAVALRAAGQPTLPLGAYSLFRSARWRVDDAAEMLAHQQQISRLLAAGEVLLSFEGGGTAALQPAPRGWRGLGLVFWLLSCLALALYLLGAAVLLSRPHLRNLMYLVMTWCQSGNLLLMAAESSQGMGMPAGWATLDLWSRQGFDVATASAAVVAFALAKPRLSLAPMMITLAAGAVFAWLLLAGSGQLDRHWLLSQGLVIALGGAACVVLTRAYHVDRDPYLAVLRRLSLTALGTLSLVTLAMLATAAAPDAVQGVAGMAATVWTLFFASLLLLVPFLSRARLALREFALLAGISTVATSFDLLFVALFSLGPFASLTLAMFLAFGVYAGARHWILNKTVGQGVLSTERTFAQLYRAAREVQAHPQRQQALLAELLRDLFDPLETVLVLRPLRDARVAGGGSALFVPLPASGDGAAAGQTLVLRSARRGQRIFTVEDARLAERVVEQLRNAVAHDLAVERGRQEERERIAQDLHDDIGARLLTLMYKVQDPDLEDYLRHTLQDLKTLTRGLAAGEHRLSHAAGEWKADIQQRLTAAGIALDWEFGCDEDIVLGVVQWSALTRILRELVSNALHHAQAQRVAVSLALSQGTLSLRVADDGCGQSPQDWSHGLGLGGVRKRVRLLGGRVAWQARPEGGVVCDVVLPGLAVAA